MKTAPAIGFTVRASPTLVLATAVVAILALVAVSASAAPRWLCAVLAVAIVVGTGSTLARLLRPSVHAAVWRDDGGMDLTVSDGPAGAQREVQGALAAARVLGPLIVLTLRWPPRSRTTLWLLPDNLGADTRRRLRARLGAHASVPPASETPDTR